MKRGIALALALMMVVCLALTGCGQKSRNPEGSQTIGQPNLAEPGPDFSQTPDSLENTAWILKGEENPNNCIAFFFKDGTATIVTADDYFFATYYYRGTTFETDPEEVGFMGEVSGANMTMTLFGEWAPTVTRVSIPEAIQYAKWMNHACKTPFDDEYPGLDDDAEESAAFGDGTVLYDDEYWTIELLGKTTCSRIHNREDAAYALRVRNNSRLPLRVTWSVKMNDRAADFYFYDPDDGSYDFGSYLLPVGSDEIYYLVSYTRSEQPVSPEDLTSVEVNFMLWTLTAEGALDDIVGEYHNTRFD